MNRDQCSNEPKEWFSFWKLSSKWVCNYFEKNSLSQSIVLVNCVYVKLIRHILNIMNTLLYLSYFSLIRIEKFSKKLFTKN